MGSDIHIRIDAIDVEKKLKKLSNVRNGAPRAIMRAMNRTVNGMKTDAAREIAAKYTVKQKDFKQKLETEKATLSNLAIVLRSTGRPLRLVKFSTRPNKRPGKKGAPTVFAKVRKDSSGGHTGGFMATMASTNGITGVFVRTGNYTKARKGSHTGRQRETIQQLYGPGTVQMLSNKETSKAIQKKAEQRFNKELDHQINYLLER